jgi:NADH-quinone oxidoreductase subunit K
MTPIPYTWVLALSAVLFAIGTLGVLLRRNGIAIFLSLEIMLNAANLAFVAFAFHFAAQPDLYQAAVAGQVFVFFVIGVAAAEAAVGLALFIALHRLKGSIDVDRANILRW